MPRSYPVSDQHIRMFNYQPAPASCMTSVSRDDLKNLSGFIIFIWLKNKRGFWFKVRYVNQYTIEGYLMQNNYWRYNKIFLSDIYGYY